MTKQWAEFWVNIWILRTGPVDNYVVGEESDGREEGWKCVEKDKQLAHADSQPALRAAGGATLPSAQKGKS